MGEVIDISGDDEIRSMFLGDYRHHRILEILELESSRLPPTIRVEIADLKMIQQPIHRRFGMRFGGMLANQIVESCESMRRKNTGHLSRNYQRKHLSRCRVVWFTLLKNIQKHIEVQRDGHWCFFSKCSSPKASRSSIDLRIPLAALTSAGSGF